MKKHKTLKTVEMEVQMIGDKKSNVLITISQFEVRHLQEALKLLKQGGDVSIPISILDEVLK